MQLVLNYGPRPAHRHDRAERIYLVWPCAAWRVVAPLPSDRRINVLQKAVLGLSRCGSYTVAEIAARLHLHPQLIETIGMELVGSGWVDPKTWRPTSKGLAMLREEESAMDSLVFGWVFQNPWTGDLWPFFAKQLKLQEATPASGHGRLSLSLESKKGTLKLPAWCLDSPASPGQPAADMVLKAIKLFRKREKLKGSMRLAESGLDELVSEGSSEMLARIAFISDQPDSVGLVTYGYLPEGGGLPPQICDPFGFACDEKMWRHLQKVAGCDEGAAAAHREFLRIAQVNDAPAFEEQLKLQRQVAEGQVVDRLSLNIKTFPAIFDHLVNAEHNLSLANATGGKSQGQLASVLQFCRQALEALLKQVAIKFPVAGVHMILTGNPPTDLSTLTGLVSLWGFAVPLPVELQPKTTGGPDKGSVKKASMSPANFYMLPSAVVATILAAAKDPTHPIRQVAARDSQLLHKLASIIRLGNAGSHDDSHDPTPKRFSIPEAKEMHQLTMQVSGCLLCLPFKESENI